MFVPCLYPERTERGTGGGGGGGEERSVWGCGGESRRREGRERIECILDEIKWGKEENVRRRVLIEMRKMKIMKKESEKTKVKLGE